MVNPFISDARSEFKDVKGDLRSAYEAGDLTRQQFQEAKDQARDVFSGFKQDVRSGGITDYSNPFANFSYTPAAGITTLDTGTTGLLDATGIATGAVTQPAPFVPSYGDLYPELGVNQENRLRRLADLYATGELEGREGKIGKLEKLLGKADLGTLESYFSKEPGAYTAPTDLGVTLPSNVTYQQLADVFRTEDPFRSYVAAQSYGLTPEQILGIRGGYQTSYYNPVQTTTGIENLLSQGQSTFTDYSIAAEYMKNPNAQIFTDNPALVNRAQQVIYAYQNPIESPVSATTTNKAGDTIAGSGQYGYQNNAPVLNADIIDQLFGDSNKIGNKAINKNQDILDELGWNFKSKEDLNTAYRGVRVVGLNENVYTDANLKAMDKGETITTEDGTTLLEYGPERQALVTAAEKLGIDPSKYESSAKLYQAIEQATSNLYAVTGGYKNQWDPEQISGISDRGNHATVMYRKVGDSLIPVSTPNLFKYQKPDDPIIGGVVGDIIANTPFLPEAVALIPGMQTYYPILKGIQTASRSGDIEDALTSGGLAWLTTNYIPKQLGPYISTEIAKVPFISDLSLVNDKLANFIVKGGTNAVISAGLAKITGQDPLEAGIAALAQSGVLTVTNQGVELASGIPDQYKPIVSRIIADAILGRNPKNSLMSVAGAFVKNELSDFMKTKGKQNEVKDTEIKV